MSPWGSGADTFNGKTVVRCLIFGFVEVPPNERLHIGRTINTGEACIKDELGDARGGLSLDLEDVRLRREQHPELELLGRHLIGHGMRVSDCFRAREIIRKVEAKA